MQKCEGQRGQKKTNMTSEEVLLKALSSGNGGIPYVDEDVTSGIVSAPPRLGRSRIFAREELMYANNHHQPLQPPQQQFRTITNSGFRVPTKKNSATRGTIDGKTSSLLERPESSQRRAKAGGSRRVTCKDGVDVEDDNPLQRYENALLRYRKPGQGGSSGLRKDRSREPRYFGNNGYSSSDDSDGAIPRCNKSKSTSSIDTQSVNNILDEYEDLDYGRSTDLSDSGSISVTNFEAVMDQRKRQQQQQQSQLNDRIERSAVETGPEEEEGEEEDVYKEREGQQHHEKRARITSERAETVFKVNQQTQVRQRSRDRQNSVVTASSAARESGVKPNSSGEDASRLRQDASSGTPSENRTENRVSNKQPPEILLRKGEVQKRVDEWLNQTQGQNFSGPTIGKRESGRNVALVRSSSSAGPKNLRRCRNDARSRSTDENSCDRLNGTASYDDVNRTEMNARDERKVEVTKNVSVVAATRGTYKDYLAVRNRSRHAMDYGFTGHGNSARSSDTVSGGSRIPQRGHVGSRRRELSVDRGVEDCRAMTNETIGTAVTSVAVTPKQEKIPTRGTRLVGETRNISGGFVKTRTSEQVSCNGTNILGNGRAASFKRARSHERNTGIATSRVTGTPVKEDPKSAMGNSRMRAGVQQYQLGTKGQPGCTEPQQQASVTSPNKVGESRRLLAVGRETRVSDDSAETVCKSAGESIKQQLFRTSEKREDALSSQEGETSFTKYVNRPSCGIKQDEREEIVQDSAENRLNSASVVSLRSPDETRTTRTRLTRENSEGVEPRRPPAPPRRDQSRRDKIESASNDQPCSSFRPNKRMYSALRQPNEQTFADARATLNESSTPKCQYTTPKPPEKIYERSLHTQVIHTNDLESILKPAMRASAYGEGAEGEASRNLKDASRSSDGREIGEIADVFHDKTEKEEENRSKESPRLARYPEIGLDQCLKVQRRNPSARSASKESPVENRALPSLRAKCWDQEMMTEPTKTFGTFQPSNAIQRSSPSTEGTEKSVSCRNNEDIDEAVVVNDSIEEPTYHELDLIPIGKLNIADSYEARSTLRLDRNPPSTNSRDLEDPIKHEGNIGDELAKSSQIRGNKFTPELSSVSSGLTAECKSFDLEEKRISAPEKNGEERSAVVNEILVKNLRFQQDLPKQDSSPLRLVGPIIAPKPFNFNSVLSDDYEKIQADDCAAKQGKDSKIYVTKEEMERQRLMDLLRRGDYEAVKLELERSYTLSTPGGGSPVCCPPCSPPPAPAAYISSVRASSRRLATGNGLGGPTSPDRDPLGKLLRYLKTFYRELGTRDPRHLPPWASPLPLGTLCPAHFQPHLQLVHKSEQEHRLENIKIDQIFAPIRLTDGTISEAPRRVAVEGGPGSGRTTLCLRLLHHWATQGEGPALAFMVSLRELRGSTLLNYLARELFPRTSALGDAVAQVWRTLHLMEDRVLFVLDGYDECLGGRPSLGDAADLLEGRLFPDARIFVTCAPTNSSTLSPLVQRRIHLAGLEWSHVERLCVAYFIHNDLAERACEFLEALNVQPTSIKQLVQHPLGWVMLCALYQDSGSLPTEASALVQAAIKCIVRRSLDRPVPNDEEIPGHCRKRLEDFGKLSLAALREGRCCYTEAELRARGGGIEVTRLGFLSRGLTFGQKRKADLFTPIHMAVAEFLAAYYLTSVAQYSNILRRELEGLPPGIIGHLAGLLGPKTHLILNQLCPLEVPPRTVFSLLKAAGASDGNISAVCRLVGAGPGFGPAPNDRPPAPLVQTSPLELEGWTRILESSACTLEALEVVFQVERGSDPGYLNDFFEALAVNESVKLVRITSLLGQEFPADEAQRLAGHLKCVLGKKRLNDFELVITCLEESAHDRLECVVSALCRGLAHASNNLARLVLDMNLSGDQVSRVCEALRNCVQVQALHLPHLSCGCEGLASVAELLKERPLLALNLAGSWGAKNEDPSSSGISMGSGSGSGSSGCASSNLGTLPLNRCYSSLPRGALAAYGSMTRPATLPRLPLGLGLGPGPGNALPTNDRDRDSNSSSKRNSDSVLCHRLPLMHPLPTCDVTSHQGTGFHEIFNAIREPNCKLRSLNVSKCLQGGLDAGCLGETIRRARYLDALRASGASRPADVMPLVLALTEAPCLQLLDLASPRLALDDHPSRLLCHALARNGTLRLLSLEGWTFRIEESDSLAVFSELLMCTSVRELSLCNARLHLAVHEGPLSRLGRRDDAGAELLRAAPPPACPTIVFLRLAGFQVTVNDRPALRGPLLLPFLAGFTSLSELDLSLDKSEIGGSSSSLLFIDDKILQNFFACFSTNFRNLQSLRINYWRVSLEDSERTMRQISKNLKLCNLSFLKANGLIVTDSAKKIQMEHVFLQTVLANLQNLTWLCLDGIKITESQATSVGKCIRDRYPGTGLEISAKDIHVKSIKSLVSAVEEAGRAEVVYTGGSSCRLKITKIQKNGKGKKK